MPKYQSKTKSKRGGRRRKITMRKVRRGRQSRKVMGGGGHWQLNSGRTIYSDDHDYDEWVEAGKPLDWQ